MKLGLVVSEPEQEMLIRQIVDQHWVVALVGSIFGQTVFDSSNDLSIDSLPNRNRCLSFILQEICQKKVYNHLRIQPSITVASFILYLCRR
jgi:hypothetical protein